MSPESTSDRRAAVARAAIAIIARDGVRALTHRAVDREAGIPQGTTSHHARTRAALVELVVTTLAEQAITDTVEFADTLTPESALSIDELAHLLAGLVDALASRRDDMRARYALILELGDNPALRAKLTTDSPVHTRTRRVTADALTAAGLPVSERRVDEVLALTDSLVFHRIAIGGPPAHEAVLAAYLHGIAGRRDHPERVTRSARSAASSEPNAT